MEHELCPLDDLTWGVYRIAKSEIDGCIDKSEIDGCLGPIPASVV